MRKHTLKLTGFLPSNVFIAKAAWNVAGTRLGRLSSNTADRRIISKILLFESVAALRLFIKRMGCGISVKRTLRQPLTFIQQGTRQYIMGFSINSKVRLGVARINTMDEAKTDSGATAIDTCIQHGREMLAAQLPLITKEKGYDFAPQFRQMTIQLYLLGVMWRCGEKLGVSTNARDHAFAALQSMLISDGMSSKQAQQRIGFLRNMSQVEEGADAHAVIVGYGAKTGDNSLPGLFDEYRGETRVSGALWRLFERGKKIMFIGGAAAAFVAIWAATILLPKSEGIDILAFGLLAAAMVVIPTFLVGLLIYRFKIKKSGHSASPPS